MIVLGYGWTGSLFPWPEYSLPSNTCPGTGQCSECWVVGDFVTLGTVSAAKMSFLIINIGLRSLGGSVMASLGSTLISLSQGICITSSSSESASRSLMSFSLSVFTSSGSRDNFLLKLLLAEFNCSPKLPGGGCLNSSGILSGDLASAPLKRLPRALLVGWSLLTY